MTQRPESSAAFNRSLSHWWDISGPYIASEPLRDERQFDVCIVGGGIIGVSSAYHLKKLDPGASVALLEADAIGFGASGRNAGQIITKFGGTTAESLVKGFGHERAAFAWEYIHRGMRTIESFAEQGGQPFDYAPKGTLHASYRSDGDAEIERMLKYVEQMGQSSYFTFVDRKTMEGEFRSNLVGSAAYDSRGGQFNPLKLVRTIKAAAESLGAEIFENSPVAFIDRSGSDIEVHTGMGAIRCKKLVLATNAFTHLLEGVQKVGLAREQSPLLVKATVSERLSPEQWEAVGWPRRCGVNILSPLFFSFAPTIDGRLVQVSGYNTHAPWDRSMAPEIFWGLKRQSSSHTASFFPGLKGLRVSHTWGGPISITPDYVPHVGATSDPRILYACGCWGNGMPAGIQHGVTLAELALEKKTDNTQSWFVQRRKRRWPNRSLAGILSLGVIFRRRRASRRIGKTLNPPISFE
ncbi:FAD-binding oxidoreductase [Corticibacterium sp. UT-5YL-CI-8]|nr:FAD-binding oxidoreductase [Tianweitania sp. UT-5YL-CI-8]